MTTNKRHVLAWLPMVGVIALAIRAALVWDDLPARMMVHFDAAGNANGWAPRNDFFILSFLVTVPFVTIFAVIAERIGQRKPSGVWAVLAVGWLGDAVIITTFWGAITANLDNAPLQVVPIWAVVLVLIPVVLAASIDWHWWLSPSRREAVSQIGHVHIVAEETHGSSSFPGLFVLMAAGMMALMTALPGPSNMRFLVMGAVIVVLLLSAVWAWRGFVYRFTTGSVEVRTLGFRLRHIPLSQIKTFRAETVNPLTDFGGWGIKGFGSDTAYIWGGHKALHIQTNHGDVYLGHNDPDRLVRDLDAIMKPVLS